MYGVDAVTHATPLIAFKETGETASFLSLMFGVNTGSLGETCRIALIITGIWLCVKRIANWRIPVAYLGSVFILSTIFSLTLGKDHGTSYISTLEWRPYLCRFLYGNRPDYNYIQSSRQVDFWYRLRPYHGCN